MKSLWGQAFDIPSSLSSTKRALSGLKDLKEPPKENLSKKASQEEQLQFIYQKVQQILGRYDSNTKCLWKREDLHAYIDEALRAGIIAIDTETNHSLDPLTCTLMGPCLYVPGQKQVYVPLNHVDPVTRKRLPQQLTEQDVAEELKRLSTQKVEVLMHNGSFDYSVIKCTTGAVVPPTWDTLVGAKILDENEPSAGLKQQYLSKIDPTVEKYSIDFLFKDIEYAVVDPEIFALYAATDAYMTYKLYQYQREVLEKPEQARLYKLFREVEMPIVTIAAEMELTGCYIDREYASRLSTKYNAKLKEAQIHIEEELTKVHPIIQKWRSSPAANKTQINRSGKTGKTKNEQLSDPVSTTSPTQLAILLYDVLQLPAVDPKSPRGTGEEILQKLNHPLCKALLEQRSLMKLLGTYIDKLPNALSSADGRLHAQFNQVGTATGRFSSSSPNLQNIPSYNIDIRPMFAASPGCKMVGGDFSQQEPRLLASYAQDEKMIGAYVEGKDLYATIAAEVYHNKYEDNLEHDVNGNLNPEGKRRRSSVKSILLGLLYGRGTASVAKQIGASTEEAQEIVDGLFASFPRVKEWIDQTKQVAHQKGYVEDAWGRRRRLPELRKPRYVVRDPQAKKVFNPVLGGTGSSIQGVTNRATFYTDQLLQAQGRRAIDQLKAQAVSEGLQIEDNTGYISRAERQCVNARVQGGAATISKKAMIAVAQDPKMQQMGFKLLICVHDELIGECPAENAEPAAERLAELMIQAALPECITPMKCDVEIMNCWYEDVYAMDLQEDFARKQESLDKDRAFQELVKERPEMPVDRLKYLLSLEV